ncbi:MAG: hypothetical protein EBY32_20255, partial [Proteobacteria bacterium]|nr:hypothetical protein [Pseudomonadota bacterium]
LLNENILMILSHGLLSAFREEKTGILKLHLGSNRSDGGDEKVPESWATQLRTQGPSGGQAA